MPSPKITKTTTKSTTTTVTAVEDVAAPKVAKKSAPAQSASTPMNFSDPKVVKSVKAALDNPKRVVSENILNGILTASY